jgi:hypothetical protein
MAGRKPAYNLKTHGWAKCAEQVRKALAANRGLHHVYIAECGDLRVMREAPSNQEHRPDEELVGVYGKATELSTIQGGIQVRLIEIFKQPAAESQGQS